MKKIILLFCCLIALTTYAQTANDLVIQLSGVQTKEVSIPQVLDYPKLLPNDKAYSIVSYELIVLPSDATAPTSFVVKDNKMPQEAIIYLRSMMGKKGKLLIEKIMVSKAGQQRMAASLTYSFNQ